RNWTPLPFPAADIDAVVLTHAHLDHSGYLPRLIREGFGGPVYCTAATRELADILLPDSGHLQEEDARRANRYGYTRHRPAEPLYTAVEAEKSLMRFEVQRLHAAFAIGDARVRLTPTGHILGAASVHIEYKGRTIVFSGDVGRPNDLIMKAPEPIAHADYLVIESTYGDRLHPAGDVRERLAEIVKKTAARGGLVMLPAFAVGRAQDLLYLLVQLRNEEKIPALPIYLDSPMAIDVTDLYSRFCGEHRLSRQDCAMLFKSVNYVREQSESRKLSASTTPKIIVAGAGMLTGGRILHHLRAFGGDHRNSIVIAGYQAPGTRGAALLGGADRLRIFGEDVRLRCVVENIEELSAHADYEEIAAWLTHLENAPTRVFVTHGEPVAADHLRQVLERRFGWDAVVPEIGEEFPL
ncbi:MAG TPA: MBL fold metallo-hydrolase, partial [Spongiibacteraceae bacterium]|nr:MBL fold metallo-hydrolase [Spongiibacteraceae bacterium]